jgi:hypothetical protein
LTVSRECNFKALVRKQLGHRLARIEVIIYYENPTHHEALLEDLSA